MALIKCPRCELNYMPDTEKYCTVCKREMRGEEEREDIELCSECGEHPVVPGEELCAFCLKEIHRQERAESDDEALAAEDVAGLDMASGMNEIAISIDQDIPSAEFMDDEDEEEDELEEEDGEDEEDEEDV